MKKVASIGFLVLLFIVSSCGSESKAVDVCRCLTEPGNSDWNKENQDACRDAISKEIGVENWEKVNMSENPEISAKFDALAKKCTEGTNNTESNNNSIESTDSKPENDNSLLIPNIGTSSGYIWESIDLKAQVYSTLAFDDALFRNTVYLMNGKNNSEDFSKMMDISGPWSAKDKNTAKGIIELNNVEVSWFFNDN